MGLQEGADIKHWALDQPVLPHEQRHHHPSQAAIAIQEGVQGLKLRMQDRQLHQTVSGIVVNVTLPGTHGIRQLVGGNGHKARLLYGATGRADPVGDAPVLTRRLALPAHP